MLTAVRTGSFLTRRRATVYCALLLTAYAAAIVALLATADGIVDFAERPLGTDFANVYAAGMLAGEGKAALAYDFPAHHDMQRQISGRADIPYYGWHYPPAFLLVAAALAPLPYLGALFAYQAATLAAYLVVVRQIVGRPDAWLPALAFPAVFVNVTHGHNGFITAALLGGALLVLDRRPVLAGVLIGCLAYKPQFGLLLPLVLAVTGRWRTILAAAVTVAAIMGFAWAAFGSEVYAAFWHSLAMTRRVIQEGAPGFHKIQSVYAALRLLGLPGTVANAVQLAATLGVAAVLAVLWRSTAAFELRAAALLIGSVLATPYALDYDLVVLAPAIAFLAVHGRREGFAPYEIALMVLLWALPLAARSIAELTAISLMPVALTATFLLILQRAGALSAPLSFLAALKSAR
jgi:hypothetical protein